MEGGYIDEARKKKDYNAASEVLTAAQALVAEYYGNPVDASGNAETASTTGAAAYVDRNDTRIAQLTGINGVTVDGVTCDTNYQINGITVHFGDKAYTRNGTAWN